MSEENNSGTNFLNILMWLYVIISQIMTIVFFVEYCRKDSIIEIIFIDSILSEIKGLLWIFFVW